MIDVCRVATPDAGVEQIVEHALTTLTTVRGGASMRRDIEAHCHANDPGEMVASLVASGALVAARQGDQLVGVLALASLQVVTVLGVYVPAPFRRGGVGLALVRYARDECDARDGWASPGDRATKSLYESAGWRARLLTMSDGES